MFWKFFTAWARTKWFYFRGYEALAPMRIVAARMEMCNLCEFESEGSCAACKCLLLSKTALASEKCPINRWGRVYTRSANRDS